MAEQNERSPGEVVFYSSPDGTVTLEVRLEQGTIWLAQRQMAELFDRDTDTIGLHLKSIYDEGELDEGATTEESSVVRTEGSRQVRRVVRQYNLDAIISVGYRVNSKRGTQFRIWATRVLRDHLVQGYTVNENRLRALNQAVRLITQTTVRKGLSGDEAQALLAVVGEYSRALELLDDYDHQRVAGPPMRPGASYVLEYEEALRIIRRLRDRFADSGLFGVERDRGLHAALSAVTQTFDGHDLYPGLEDKAANLLYFLVKDHAFVDGNKRIAASLFLWYLNRNDALLRPDGTPRISDAALVGITLMIAESRPDEKEILVRIVVHLLIDGDIGDQASQVGMLAQASQASSSSSALQ